MKRKSKLLIATHNPAKLEEISRFLQDLPVELVSLADLDITEDVEEDGETFEENAVKKAKYFAKICKLPTLADDGGVEIDYLAGEPGVHSRRWIDGRDASDEELIEHTLKLLEDVPQKEREAQLRAVLALALPAGKIHTVEGKTRGVIAKKPYTKKRWRGFPFRSLFYFPKIGKYYNPADMTEQEEIQYNHRRRALEELKPLLKQRLDL